MLCVERRDTGPGILKTVGKEKNDISIAGGQGV